jgi:CheY-like chemotaxis protein
VTDEAVLELDDTSHAIALVVEDNKSVLKARRTFLESQGFVAIPASSYHEALKEFRSIPRVDLVLTDINLPSDSRYAATDTSGATLAQVLRAVSSDLPIYGYSAIFADEELSPDLTDAFTGYYPKGKLTPDQQIGFAEEWRLAAGRHRDARGQRAQEDLKRLRESYQNLGREFAVVRDLVPQSGSDQEQASVEELLARAGYRVRLLEPGDSRPRLGGNQARTCGPIVLWVKTDRNLAIAEVYGFPELYGNGATEEAAIADVLLLMDGYFEDLREAKSEGISDNLARLRRYLISVFGEYHAAFNE